MSNLNSINPFYAARHPLVEVTHSPRPLPQPPQYAKLPRAPLNASPVPTLTSLYHSAEAGDYGDRRYPGNCGGNLIKDLLRFYRPGLICDPLCGAPHNGSSVAESVMWRLSSERRFHGGGMESVAT